MQTFLPIDNFMESAKVLDYRRLGKQRLEAKQILKIRLGEAKPNKNGNIPWGNHPAVKMWQGYEIALKLYYNCIVMEWINRGYNNTMVMYQVAHELDKLVMPPFYGNKEFHDSHKSNLLRKYPEHYSQFGWEVPDDLEYVWSVDETVPCQ